MNASDRPKSVTRILDGKGYLVPTPAIEYKRAACRIRVGVMLAGGSQLLGSDI